MPDKRDYYETLGISKSASDDEIKRAYRKLAKQYHPDLHPGDKEAEAKFKEINEAYEVLSDQDKKSKYDQFGFAGVDPNYGAGQGGYQTYGGGSGFGDIGDIFSSIFGGGFGGGGFGGEQASRNAPRRGDDIERGIVISFEEAAFGCEKDVQLSRVERCETCGGSGAAAGTTADTCPDCHGSGTVRTMRRTALGTISTTGVCPNCRGTGKIIKSPCQNCRGTGYTRRGRTITVKIPAGIDNGQTVIIRGQGNQGQNNGPAGDLLVTINVQRHAYFERDGANLLCTVPITITQATLGDEIDIPTLEGSMKYQIPEGVQSGTQFRIPKRGLAQINARVRGDYLLTVVVETPRGLTGKQKDLLREFAKQTGDKNYVQKKAFFDKLKSTIK